MATPADQQTASASRRLEIAIGVSVIEVLVQIAFLLGRGVLGGAPLRIVFLAAKLPICALAWRKNPGAYLGVWLFEMGGLLAAITVHGPLGGRVVTGVLASLTMALLASAIPAFPTVEWKSR